MKVRAIDAVHERRHDEREHQNLAPGRVYEVIGLDDENYRVVNDAGEPILYPKALFEVTDPTIPQEWVRRDYVDGEYHHDPPEFSDRGFFERYFDGRSREVEIFRGYLDRNRIES
jgi:hypothetical protein